MLYCLRFINLFVLKKTATIYNNMSIICNMYISCYFYFCNLKNIVKQSVLDTKELVTI